LPSFHELVTRFLIVAGRGQLPHFRLAEKTAGLTDFFYFAGTNAARAHTHAHMGAVCCHAFDRLQIRLGHLFAFVVGMAHLIAAELALSAYFTCSRHCKTSVHKICSNEDAGHTIP
jgi:hypothetical protein